MGFLDKIKDKAGAFKDVAEEKLADAKEKAGPMIDKAQSKVDEQLDKLDD